MRKSMLTALTCGVLVAGFSLLSFGEDPEIVWREKVRATVSTNGVVVATDTNVTTVASQKTPAFVGQFLFGWAGTGTNAAWVAKGLTTNDWVRIAP